MKSVFALVALFAFLSSFSVDGWECDRRCSGYDECVRQNNNRRVLEGKDVLEEDLLDGPDELTSVIDVVADKNLRGSITGEEDVHRQLDEHFQLRLYWESEYCWQEERRERWWCWECDGSCDNGSEVHIERCDDSSRQRWVYKGDGKISPRNDQSLCFGRKDSNDFRLMECGGGDTEMDGFESSGRFELKHDGKCVSQDHDPKSGEEVKPMSCSEARGDHTSYWIVYNPSTSGSSGSSGSSGTTRIDFRGSDWCNKNGNRKCRLCEGDCDDDEDCKGDLVCKERDAYDSISSYGCSGGGSDSSESDYCVPP